MSMKKIMNLVLAKTDFIDNTMIRDKEIIR